MAKSYGSIGKKLQFYVKKKYGTIPRTLELKNTWQNTKNNETLIYNVKTW